MTTLKAPLNRVIIKPDALEAETAGGIVVNAPKLGATHTGLVVAVGPEMEAELKPGQRLAYRTKSVRDFEHEGETYHAIPGTSALAVLEPTPA